MVHVGQYDSDFSIVFNLYASTGTFNLESGTTAEIRGTKKDGNGYSASATIDITNKKVTVAGHQQMTAVAGQQPFELVLLKNNKPLSTANFILDVERAALDADTIRSDTVLKELQAIIDSAAIATEAAEDAEDAADRAEAAAQTLEIDDTLTQAGQAADAKKTGDEITDLKADLAESPLITRTAREALLTCFEHVFWDDDNGKTYTNALRVALGITNRRPELPNEYEQVEFIKGTGTQYINTQILSQVPFKAEAKIAYAQAEARVIAGSASSLGNTRFIMFGFGNYNGNTQGKNQLACRYGNNTWMYNANATPQLNTPYELRTEVSYAQNNRVAATFDVVDDSSFHAENNYAAITLGNPILIMKSAAEASCGIGISVYKLKLYAGNTLLFDGIPCYRKSDNVTGMYDAVTHTFFANNGTGSFVLGEIVE